MVDWLIKTYPALLPLKNSKGETALALAMKQGGLENKTATFIAAKVHIKAP